MFRFTIVAYLILTTVIRPALCCCTARQVLADSTCCSTKVASEPVASPHAHKPHKNCRGHAKVQSQPASQKVVDKEQQPKPCDHKDSSCPCGKSFASITMMTSAGYQHGNIELQGKLWAEDCLHILDLPAASVIQKTSLLAQIWHSDLYGVGILRAYQIMRC